MYIHFAAALLSWRFGTKLNCEEDFHTVGMLLNKRALVGPERYAARCDGGKLLPPCINSIKHRFLFTGSLVKFFFLLGTRDINFFFRLVC